MIILAIASGIIIIVTLAAKGQKWLEYFRVYQHRRLHDAGQETPAYVVTDTELPWFRTVGQMDVVGSGGDDGFIEDSNMINTCQVNDR